MCVHLKAGVDSVSQSGTLTRCVCTRDAFFFVLSLFHYAQSICSVVAELLLVCKFPIIPHFFYFFSKKRDDKNYVRQCVM